MIVVLIEERLEAVLMLIEVVEDERVQFNAAAIVAVSW